MRKKSMQLIFLLTLFTIGIRIFGAVEKSIRSARAREHTIKMPVLSILYASRHQIRYIQYIKGF